MTQLVVCVTSVVQKQYNEYRINYSHKQSEREREREGEREREREKERDG